MAIYHLLVRVTRGLMVATTAVTATILAVIVMIVAAEIANRSLFGGSFSWVYESLQLLGNWMYFLGIALVYDRASDISIDWFYARFPVAVRRFLLLVIHVLILVALCALAVMAIRLMEIQFGSLSMGMRIPNYIFTLPILIGSAFMILSVIRQLLAIALDLPEWKAIEGSQYQ